MIANALTRLGHALGIALRSADPRRLARDRRGNVMMIFAFSVVPITFATGMGIDYGSAMRLQTRYRAAADAAALAATSQQLLNWDPALAKQAAQVLFKQQTQGTPGVTLNYDDTAQFNVDVTDSSGASNVRTATVTFRGESKNSFAGILGMSTLTIRGTSTATASTAPNIDFYVLLDSSSSMALPSTSAGLNQLTKLTGGCAFACHSTNDEQARDKNNKLTDYYGVATSYGIPLRFDEAKKAVQSMMTVATSTSQANGASYRAWVASFAAKSTQAPNHYTVLTNPALSADLATVRTQAGTATTSLYNRNNCPTASFCNSDTDTATSDAFDQVNAAMPTPGDGKRLPGHTPQQILFVITDGMRDENRPGGKPEVAIDTAKCDTIKSKGTRIAILYTEYLPESVQGNTWATDVNQGNVLNRIPLVEPALQLCATTGLYYKVSTDDDISGALNSLFQKAVASSHLTR
jgi:Flp pilus assembly protein TadG